MGDDQNKLPTHIRVFDSIRPFVFGGFAGICATSVIQPMDTIKVRIQCTGVGQKGVKTGLWTTGAGIIKSEGVGALYAGYSAAVLRQAVYGTARLGLYQTFVNHLQHDSDSPLPFYQKVGCGLLSGAMGSTIGNPCDLALVRMQADGQLPVEQRRNYSNVFQALSRISKEEGILALWRGSRPTVCRAMAINVGMLSTHSQAKDMLLPVFGDGAVTRFSSSFIAGITAACVTLPFDLIKTRIQQMQPDANGNFPYKGIVHCGSKVVTEEGFFALWKGLGTFCVRVAPHAVITLMVMDNLNEKYNDWRKKY